MDSVNDFGNHPSSEELMKVCNNFRIHVLDDNIATIQRATSTILPNFIIIFLLGGEGPDISEMVHITHSLVTAMPPTVGANLYIFVRFTLDPVLIVTAAVVHQHELAEGSRLVHVAI